MIKKTLYFGKPAYLSTANEQLVVKLPEVEKNDTLPHSFKKEAMRTLPIEDLGVIVIDHSQITLTSGLLAKLLENNCAIITCDNRHMPLGLMFPLEVNSMQTERFRVQIEASLPLKKQLWQQTISAKIENQAHTLSVTRGVVVKNLLAWAADVKSGDSENKEARAAVYYWNNLFPELPSFTRGKDEMPPNNLLNYGYAILRAVMARALVASGLLPTLGIFHRNKYNAYCLADDIMEPYRPFVDSLVVDIVKSGNDYSELTPEIKVKLLSIPIIDVKINGQKSPLMIAVGQTAASLYKCFDGELRKIAYPSPLD